MPKRPSPFSRTPPLTRERLASFEEQAQLLRARAGAAPLDPIDPVGFARGLNAVVQYPDEVPGITPELLAAVARMDARSWSGGAQLLPDGRLHILVSRNQTRARRAVTILEELAHHHYGHARSALGPGGRMGFDPAQEQEAYQTAAAVLLPAKVVASAVRRQAPVAALAASYGASRRLVEMRIKVLGLWKDHIGAPEARD